MITDIDWQGGAEFTVPGAPPGFESLHFGTAFSCSIAVPDGVYLITLAFIEPTVTGPGQRVFDVRVNDQVILASLDVFYRAGLRLMPIWRPVIVAVTGGTLAFDFRATVRSAVVSGIVVELLANVLLGG